jgi:lactoylglutathione lyase
MLRHLTHVTIYVKDQDAALAFYRDMLGFSVSSDEQFGPGMRWLTVRPPGGQTDFALWPEGNSPKGKQAAGGWTGMVLKCDDLDGTYAELSAKGVNFPQPPKDVPWGRDAMLCDPDGNEFNLVQH